MAAADRGDRALKGLLTLTRELQEFRVLDPACGSGDFLYVAYRELVNLEMGILAKIHDNFGKKGEAGRDVCRGGRSDLLERQQWPARTTSLRADRPGGRRQRRDGRLVAAQSRQGRTTRRPGASGIGGAYHAPYHRRGRGNRITKRPLQAQGPQGFAKSG